LVGLKSPRDGGLAVTDCVAGLWWAVESLLKEIRAMTGFRGGRKKHMLGVAGCGGGYMRWKG
jgi:hypothetical protein